LRVGRGQPADEIDERFLRPASKRISRADVHDDDGIRLADAGLGETSRDHVKRGRILGHLGRIGFRIGWLDAKRPQHVELADDRVARAKRAGVAARGLCTSSRGRGPHSRCVSARRSAR
jgi:hypothetical protein